MRLAGPWRAARGFLIALAGMWLVGSGPLAQAEVVDRIVALVDDDPILLSEIERTLALGLVSARAGATPDARAALDRLIDQRLRHHAVARSGVIEIGRDQVEIEVERVLARFPDPAARLRELGLDRDALRGVVQRQLELRTYVEERLGARVFVSLEQIREHYDDQLVPELVRQNALVPELTEVREQIRALLREQALEREVEVWTEELRRQADIIDLLDEPQRADPPQRVLIEASRGN